MDAEKTVEYRIADGRKAQLDPQWIVLNPEDAPRAQSVCAIQVRNAPKGTPRFVYFVMGKEVRELKHVPDRKIIDEAIAQVWSPYAKIAAERVEAVCQDGQCVNALEHMAHPYPEYFALRLWPADA